MDLAVPDFFYVSLAQVGVVRITDMGLVLSPTFDFPTEVSFAGNTYSLTPMTKNELIDFSTELYSLENYGFTFGSGYPMNSDGSLEFMTMCVVGDVVKGTMPDSHPAFALISAFLDVRGIESVLTPVVKYSYVSHFDSLIRTFTKGRASRR